MAVAGVFILWFMLFVAGLAFTEKVSVQAATVLYEVGMPWMIAFLYLFLFFVIADIGVLCRLFPKAFFSGSVAGFSTVIILTIILMITGNIHYRHKYREELTIQTSKPLTHPLTIVLASDLHLGYHSRRSELARWVDMFNAENPDIILFGGDLVDRSARPVLAGDYASEFKRITAPMFTVLGNHEYYGEKEAAERFFKDANITVLQDGSIEVGSIRIIGRDDRTNPGRKTLQELVADTCFFSILLDHQPYHLEEAEAAGIDFQFSGHTHRGQVWPASWVTDAIYEKSWGVINVAALAITFHPDSVSGDRKSASDPVMNMLYCMFCQGCETPDDSLNAESPSAVAKLNFHRDII